MFKDQGIQLTKLLNILKLFFTILYKQMLLKTK